MPSYCLCARGTHENSTLDLRLAAPIGSDHDGVLCQCQALEPGRVRGAVPCPGHAQTKPSLVSLRSNTLPHLPDLFSVFFQRLPC